MHDWRAHFPMLSGPLLYFDTAATAQKPQVVIDAICKFYTEQYGTVHRAVYSLAAASTAAYNEARVKVQHFLNAARPEEIIFTRGTTDAINLVATCFGKKFLQSGDEVIISEIEHHSNLVSWQMICEERGAILRFIPVNDLGELDLDAYAALLNPRTKLVSIAHISNSIGTLHPIAKIIAMAHANGSKVMIDAAQSAPHLPIDVQALDVDFLAFSGHKIYGPTGVGVLYGKYELLEVLPPYQGGGDMIQEVSLTKSTYAEPPLRFEAGTPMIAEVIGLGAAIDFLESIGLDNICRHEQALLDHLENGLKTIPGLKIIGNARKKGGIVAFVVDGVHPLDLGILLDLKGVAIRTGHHCSQTTMHRFGITHTCRISLGLYNTIEEIDQLVLHLHDYKNLLGFKS